MLLLLFLLLPVGVDAAYAHASPSLKLKVGFLRFRLLPKQEKKEKPQEAQSGGEPKKPRKGRKKKDKEDEKRDGLKLGRDDVFALLRLLLRTLRRFRKHLSIDLFRFLCTVGSADPYDTVLRFGALNAGLGTLAPLAESVLNVRQREIGTDFDLEADSAEIDARIVATLQVWEILFIVFCAGAAALSWYLGKRKQARIAASADAEKGT